MDCITNHSPHDYCPVTPPFLQVISLSLSLWLLTTPPFLQVICVCPTIDLCQQTGHMLKQMAKFILPEVTMAYADENGQCDLCVCVLSVWSRISSDSLMLILTIELGYNYSNCTVSDFCSL